MPEDQFTNHNIERPCGHMQTISIRTQQSLADYNFRVVPALREAMQGPCEQCEKAKAELAKKDSEQEQAAIIKQKLMEKAGKK